MPQAVHQALTVHHLMDLAETVTLAEDLRNHMALHHLEETMVVHLKLMALLQLDVLLNLTELLQTVTVVHLKATEHLKLLLQAMVRPKLLLQAMELHLLAQMAVEDLPNPMVHLRLHLKTMELLHRQAMVLLPVELHQEVNLTPAMEDTATKTNRHFVHISRIINLLRQIVQY